MRSTAIGLTTLLVLASGSFGPAKADSARPLLVPGYEAARDLPGARELPDPEDRLQGGLRGRAGREESRATSIRCCRRSRPIVNTLGKYGVPPEHRHLVIMFHQRTPDIDIVMTQRGVQGALQPRQPEHRDHPRAQAGRRRHPRLRSGTDRPEDRFEAGQSRRPDRSLGHDDAGEPAAEGLRAGRVRRRVSGRPSARAHGGSAPASR